MEKVKRKEKKRDIKKRWFLVAAVIVAAGVTGLLLHEKNIENTTPAPLPEQIEKEIIPAAKQVDIVNLAEDQVVSLAVWPRDYTAYTLERTEGGMQLKGAPETPLRADVVGDILYAAGALKANITIGPAEELKAELPHFGFETPTLRYEIEDVRGEKIEVLLGNKVPDDEVEQYFCLAGGMVYTVLAEPCDVLFHHVEYLRDFKQPQLQADLMDQIILEGEKNISFRYTPDGFVMETPVEYPVQKAKMDAVLNYIERMAFEAYLGTAEENDLAALGLEEPCLTVTLIQAPSVVSGITTEWENVTFDVGEQTYTLLIGNDTGASGVYLIWNGGVYKGSNFLFGFWKDMQAEEFYSKTPMHFQVDRLQSLQVKKGEETTLYEVEMVEVILENNQIATDEYGQTLYDARVEKNGEEMDAAAFLNWYVQLNTLPVSGKLQETMQGDALYAVTLKTGSVERQVVFRHMDALHALMEVDGEAVFYVEKSALQLFEQLP